MEGSQGSKGAGLWAKLRPRARSVVEAAELAETEAEIMARTRVGAYYVQDAVAGRLNNGKAALFKKSATEPWKYRAFVFHVSSFWSDAIIVINLLHCALVVYEPAQLWWEASLPGPAWVYWSEVLCIALYAFDVALKAFYQSLKTYVTKQQQVFYASVVATLLLDVVLLPSRRFTRPFRPLVMLVRVRAVRRFYTVVMKMLHPLSEICLPILFMLMLAAALSTRLLGHAVTELQTFGSSFYAFFVLLTTADNYSALMDGALRVHPTAAVLVFAFLIVGSWFLVSLVLGACVDAYMDYTRDQLQDERLKCLKGFSKAFAELDKAADNTGHVSFNTWRGLFLHIKPGVSAEEALDLYNMMLSGEGTQIDAVDFLELSKVLRLRQNHDPSVGAAERTTGLSRFCRSVVCSAYFRPVVSLAVLFDVALLCAGWEASVPHLNAAVVALFAVEQALKVGACHTPGLFWFYASHAQQMDAIVVVLQLLGLAFDGWSGSSPTTLAARSFVNGLRITRALSCSAVLQKFASAVADVLPLFWQTFGFAFVILYVFTLVGLELMGTVVSSFESWSAAALTLLKILFSVDFAEVMGQALERTSSSFIIGLYFVAYFALGVLILVNLLTALCLDFYTASYAPDSLQGELKEATLEAAERLQLAQHRREAHTVQHALKLWTHHVGEDVKDLRDIVGSRASFELTDKEIKACQKYATVDLQALRDAKEQMRLRPKGRRSVPPSPSPLPSPSPSPSPLPSPAAAAAAAAAPSPLVSSPSVSSPSAPAPSAAPSDAPEGEKAPEEGKKTPKKRRKNKKKSN